MITQNRDAEIRARIQEHWDASERGDADAEHAIYAADAILDYPQSGERFRGRSRIQAQRGGHPAERHFTIRRIVGGGDLWVSECLITYDGVPTYSLSVMEIADGFVAHETQYFADPFQASPGRAPLAEPIPAPDQNRAAVVSMDDIDRGWAGPVAVVSLPQMAALRPLGTPTRH